MADAVGRTCQAGTDQPGLGSEAALRAAHAVHSAELYRFALRELDDEGGTLEVVQAVVLRTWRRAESFDPAVAGGRVWFFAIARDAVVDETRRVAVRPWRRTLTEAPEGGGHPGSAAEVGIPVGMLRSQVFYGLKALRLAMCGVGAEPWNHDEHRTLRESLGTDALGQLGEPGRTTLAAHLDGCAACRGELSGIAPVVAGCAASTRTASTPPLPPELGEQIVSSAIAERRTGPPWCPARGRGVWWWRR